MCYYDVVVCCIRFIIFFLLFFSLTSFNQQPRTNMMYSYVVRRLSASLGKKGVWKSGGGTQHFSLWREMKFDTTIDRHATTKAIFIVTLALLLDIIDC